MIADTSSSPYLPPEIERLIFEMTFDINDPRLNARLTLVARRVREWIRPLIFRFFDQSKGKIFPNFERYKDTLNMEEVGKMARYLVISMPGIGTYCDNTRSPDKIHETISLLGRYCHNLEVLAYCLPTISLDFIICVNNMHNLRKLSMNFDFRSPVDDSERDSRKYLDTMILPKLTHLDAINFHREWSFDVLSRYTSLTHFFFFGARDWNFEVLKSIFDICPSLQVCIIGLSPQLLQEDTLFLIADISEEVGNHRIVFFHENTFSRDDWICGIKGEFDHWRFADMVVSARENKYFLYKEDIWGYIPATFDWEHRLTDEGRVWFYSQSIRPEAVSNK